MKKALDLLLVYVLILLIGIVSTTFLYSFYINILNYVAGNKVTFFTNEDLIKSLIYSTYCILLFICPVISYYRIRRPSGVPQTLGFIFIALLTWVVFIPGASHIEKKLGKVYQDSGEEVHLSQGYFRKVDKKVYYFTKEFESENHNVAKTNAIIIDTNEHGQVDYKTVRDIGSMDFNKRALPFKEILVKQNFDNSRITLPINFNNLFAKLKKCISLEWYYIWYFLSFALVICSVYALTNFFSWKLLNSVLIFFITVAVISANSVDENSWFVIVNNALSGTKPFEFLSQYIYEEFLFTFNILCSLVFLTFGIVKFAIHNHVKKN